MAFESLTRTDKEAHKLLQRFGVSAPPVDVEKIARELGLDIRYERFQRDLSGVLVKSSDSKVIGINSSHARVRQRFSIAHEIGHFWLAHPGDMFVDEIGGQASVVFRDGRSGDATNIYEMEANRFAAALLMPAELLVNSFLSCSPQDAEGKMIVNTLANQYEVSTQAMKIRLSSLGLMLAA